MPATAIVGRCEVTHALTRIDKHFVANWLLPVRGVPPFVQV